MRSEVVRFLACTPAAWFCDGCVALDIKASLDEARTALVELEADRRVERGEERCSRCGRALRAIRTAGRPAA